LGNGPIVISQYSINPHILNISSIINNIKSILCKNCLFLSAVRISSGMDCGLGKTTGNIVIKKALICNRLRTVSKIGGDTPSHKATAVQAQRFSEKSEQVSNFILFWCGR